MRLTTRHDAVAVAGALACILAIAALSPVVPRVVFNGLDGAYLFVYFRQSFDWQSGLGTLGMDFVRGAGNLTFPLAPDVVAAYAASRAFLGRVDPTFAVLFQMAVLYFTTAAIARAAGFDRSVGVLAGATFALYASPAIWQPPIWPMFAMAPHFADLMALPGLAVALFAALGRGSAVRDGAILAALGVLGLYAVVSNPLLVVTIAGGAVIYGVGALAGARGVRELVAKSAALLPVLGIALGTGTIAFLLGIADYSVPRFFSRELAANQSTLTLASLFYQGSPLGHWPRAVIAMGFLEAALLLWRGDARARAWGFSHLAAGAIFIAGGWIAVRHVEGWRGPPLIYFEMGVWPFYVVFAAGLVARISKGLWALVRICVRDVGPAAPIARILPAVAVTVGYGAWLAFGSTPTGTSFAPFPPRPTEISSLLRAELGLVPGGPFRGRVATFVGGRPEGTGWGRLHAYDAEIYGRTGNEPRLLGPWYDDVPTFQEYTQGIAPATYLLQSRFLSFAADTQIRNISLVTRPDDRLLAALGVAYVVHDAPIAGLEPIARVTVGGGLPDLRAYPIAAPNVGDYSPLRVRVVPDFAAAMRFLAERPDLREEIAVFEPLPTPAGRARARFEIRKGALIVGVESQGPSILLLPFEFSRCLRIEGPAEARLTRANVVQTALATAASGEFRVTLRYSIFENSDCRRQDARDMTTFDLRGAGAAFPRGVGRN
jgi:hypothetical protein